MPDLVIPSSSLVSIERHDAVLSVSGEIDIASSPALRAALESALDDGLGELWLDLSATSFMDSSGLHVLLEAQGQAETLCRRLTIVCPPGNVRRILDLTGLMKVLDVRDALADA